MDRHHLTRAEIDRRGGEVVAMHDHVDAFDTVVDIHEASGLIAVTPDADLAASGVNRLDDLTADGGRGLFATAIPSTEGTVNVVETGDESFHPPLVPVFLAKHLADQFLPAVATLGHRGVGVGFLERADVWVLLEQGVVHASGTGKEVASDPRLVSRLCHMRVDENAAEAPDSKALDETHAAHVR